MRLRSVELALPQARAAAEFLQEIWGLIPAGSKGGAFFFRGTGSHPYILALREAPTSAVLAIEFSGLPAEVAAVQARAQAAGAPLQVFAELDVPVGGAGCVVEGPEKQKYRFIAEDAAVAQLPPERDRPLQITHVVLNSVDVAACERFVAGVLGFQVSDRTKIMSFVRCNRKHHALAYAHSDTSSLNHIAFEMNDVDGVMRGIGRMRDAGHDVVWGPGRHGPGDNVFAYFIAPFGGVIEYTTEVSEVTDDYRVGSPEDWKWPPGRIDQWGISTKDTARISAAERIFRFA